jgi:hypothetical protein
MCYFIVGLPLNAGSEKDLEEIAAIWSNDKDLVNALGLIARFLPAAHGN